MSIQHKIPTKARIIPTENTFSAAFLGTYDFSVAANTRQTVFKLDANSVYFLDNFSVGGNIASEDFLSCISTVPVMTLSRKNDSPGSTIYTRSFPITQFYQNKDCTCFVFSNKGDDELVVSLSGILNQNSNIIGVDPLKLTLSFSCFAMDDRTYNAEFRDQLPNAPRL